MEPPGNPGRFSGLPVVLKISFYKDKPIVPNEVIPGFLRTRMNMLVLGERFIKRTAAAQ